MHKLNILVFGPNNFISTLNEIKHYLKFNFLTNEKTSLRQVTNKCDVIIIHQDSLENAREFLNDKTQYIKILVTKNNKKKIKLFDDIIRLPTTIKEINNIVENSAVKKQFNKNSAIQIKEYILDKNEKRLLKHDKSIILTGKEIQLLEIFLNNNEPISKKKILSSIWQYSPEADTHTVETHIYRLRKKLNDQFSDDKFILNNKDGYYL